MAAPKGHSRWGGRKRGVPNAVNVQTRNEIGEQADPIGFLCEIVNGQEIDGERPTLDQRMQAARILAGKVLPDLRAVEVAGVGPSVIFVETGLSGENSIPWGDSSAPLPVVEEWR